MPRRLDGYPFESEDWYRISQADLQLLPEVKAFMSSLEFCDAVVQVYTSTYIYLCTYEQELNNRCSL